MRNYFLQNCILVPQYFCIQLKYNFNIFLNIFKKLNLWGFQELKKLKKFWRANFSGIFFIFNTYFFATPRMSIFKNKKVENPMFSGFLTFFRFFSLFSFFDILNVSLQFSLFLPACFSQVLLLELSYQINRKSVNP